MAVGAGWVTTQVLLCYTHRCGDVGLISTAARRVVIGVALPGRSE